MKKMIYLRTVLVTFMVLFVISCQQDDSLAQEENIITDETLTPRLINDSDLEVPATAIMIQIEYSANTNESEKQYYRTTFGSQVGFLYWNPCPMNSLKEEWIITSTNMSFVNSVLVDLIETDPIIVLPGVSNPPKDIEEIGGVENVFASIIDDGPCY